MPSATLGQGGRPLLIPAEDEGEALATLIVNRIGVRTELGATWPGSSPELKNFAQNLDLAGGWYAAAGPFISIPVGGRASPFDLRFGVDVFTARQRAERITNQLVPGVLPVSGHWKQYGVIPHVGLVFAADNFVRGLELFVDVGYGFARHEVDLSRAQPILEGSDTTGIFRTRFGFDIPITRHIRVGVAASYLQSGNNGFRVVQSGQTSAFGRNDQLMVLGSLSVMNVVTKSGGLEMSGPVSDYLLDHHWDE